MSARVLCWSNVTLAGVWRLLLESADALVEIWRFIERLGKKPTARKAMEIARILGFKVRNENAYRLLAKFGERPGSTPTISTGALFEHGGSILSSHREAPRERLHVRDKGTPSSKEQATPATPPARQLQLVDEEEQTARAILATIWPRIQPHVHGMTRTEWGKRNKRYARDMALAGTPIDRVMAAHTAASQRLGAPVYSLRIVQDQLTRDATPLGSGSVDPTAEVLRV